MTKPDGSARIEFRAKVETVYELDGSEAYTRVKMPRIDARHCDMTSFRAHPTFGGLANSKLFPGLLARSLRRLGITPEGFIRLDRTPDCVSVDTSGFLAKVVIAFGPDVH